MYVNKMLGGFFSLGQRINFLYIAYEFIVLPEWDLSKDDFPTE